MASLGPMSIIPLPWCHDAITLGRAICFGWVYNRRWHLFVCFKSVLPTPALSAICSLNICLQSYWLRLTTKWKNNKRQTNRQTSRLNLHRGRFSVKHVCAGGWPVQGNGEEVEDGGGAAEDITGGPEVTEEGTHDPSPGDLGKGDRGHMEGKVK